MLKIILFGLAFTYICYAEDKNENDQKGGDLNNVAAPKNMDFPALPPFPKLPFNFPFKPGTFPDPDTIRNMKCEGLTDCKASFHSESSVKEVVNGQVVEDEQKVDDIKNDNGKVSEEHLDVENAAT